MLSNKKGFTLIELVMIIVILGILAAVAIPRYVDLKGDADKANAKGVLGAMNSAMSIAYAKYLVNGTNTTARCDGTVTSYIDQGLEVGACMDGGFPTNWNQSTTNVTYLDSSGTTHTFPVATEGSTNRAVIRMTDTSGGAGWP